MADYIAKQYKPCIFVVNKWDLIATDPEADMKGAMGKFANGVQFSFRNMAYMPLAFITAQTGKNVKALLNLSQSMFKQAKQASRHLGPEQGPPRRGRVAPAVVEGGEAPRGSIMRPRSASRRRRSSSS